MKGLVPLWLALAGAAQAADEPVLAVPSGQEVFFHDSSWTEPGQQGLVYRFRFIAPEIGKGIDFDAAAPDMEHLCNSYALPRLPNTGPRPSQVIISLADKPIDFGVTDPEVTQFFEAYAVEDGACVWEVF